MNKTYEGRALRW